VASGGPTGLQVAQRALIPELGARKPGPRADHSIHLADWVDLQNKSYGIITAEVL